MNDRLKREFSHKFLSVILSAVLMLAMIGSLGLAGSMKVLAAGNNWSDEANRDTTWTDGAISTPQQLAQFAYLVNTEVYAGGNSVWLTADIDLDGKEWIPIGNENDDNKIYKGIFNGNGFTVSNMSITNFTGEKVESLYGLFGLLGGTVKNVNVTGSITCSAEYDYFCYIGGIAGYSVFGSIINCVSNVTITIESITLNASSIGGIVGENYGEVIGCVNNGDIYMLKGNSSPIGGITGYCGGNIDRCENNGDIESFTTYIGGIVGYSYVEPGYYDNPFVTNCYNAGNISDINGTTNLYYGGIAGYISNVLVENCYYGSLASSNVTWGNLVGELYSGNINNCYFLENGSFGLGRIGNDFVTSPEKDLGIQKTDSQLKDLEFVGQLNGIENAFYYNEGGYPLLLPLPMSVAINTSPENADVVVKQDGSIIDPENDGTYLLVPGSYEVSANAENYVPKAITVTVTAHQDTHTVNIDLDILPADYSAVDLSKTKIPSDLSVYTDDSVTVLNTSLLAVTEGLDITKQEQVDGYAKAIEDAINALTYKDADYSAVMAAKAKIPADLSFYTDDSVILLNTAVSAVIEGLDITKQSAVDGYAAAIENAVRALVLKTSNNELTEAIENLEEKVTEAQNLIKNIIIGGKVGQYPQAAADKLNKAIDDARLIIEDEDAPLASAEKALEDLQKAIDDFKSSVVKAEPPKTGDSSNLLFYYIVLALSGGLTVITLIAKKHKKA